MLSTMNHSIFCKEQKNLIYYCKIRNCFHFIPIQYIETVMLLFWNR